MQQASAVELAQNRRDAASAVDIFDVGLADATAACRDRLPDALGAGTTQG